MDTRFRKVVALIFMGVQVTALTTNFTLAMYTSKTFLISAGDCLIVHFDLSSLQSFPYGNDYKFFNAAVMATTSTDLEYVAITIPKYESLKLSNNPQLIFESNHSCWMQAGDVGTSGLVSSTTTSASGHAPIVKDLSDGSVDYSTIPSNLLAATSGGCDSLELGDYYVIIRASPTLRTRSATTATVSATSAYKCQSDSLSALFIGGGAAGIIVVVCMLGCCFRLACSLGRHASSNGQRHQQFQTPAQSEMRTVVVIQAPIQQPATNVTVVQGYDYQMAPAQGSVIQATYQTAESQAAFQTFGQQQIPVDIPVAHAVSYSKNINTKV